VFDEEPSFLDTVRAGREVMETEAKAVFAAAQRLDQQFLRAVESILGHRGKVVVTGIGKSGRVGEKLVATLSSTGTPAVFLHPAEASHGDLGIYHRGDPTIVISKSGATSELLRLVPLLRELESPLIGILGNLASPLARCMDIVLDASIQAEADPHNLTPSASTSVALALGDALAIALMSARQFMPEDFARNHPGGQLGRNLRLSVLEVMKVDDQVAWAAADDALKQVIIAMTQRPLGAACVVSEGRRLIGLVTDGDLRRALQVHDDIRGLLAGDVMTRNPITIPPEATLHDALQMMENRPSQISVLPVAEPATGRCLGLLRLHDIYHAGIIA
jgi:arabinose-5-phosphate isomerase